MTEQAPGDFKTKSQPKKAWKKWESDFAAACRQVAKEPGHYNRIIRLRDSYDAGGKMMGDSDGDFIWVCTEHVYLLELKHSEVHESLRDAPKELITKRQLGCHRGWAVLGQETLFGFKSSASGTIEFWSGNSILALAGGAKFAIPAATGPATPESLKDLVRYFTRSDWL